MRNLFLQVLVCSVAKNWLYDEFVELEGGIDAVRDILRRLGLVFIEQRQVVHLFFLVLPIVFAASFCHLLERAIELVFWLVKIFLGLHLIKVRQVRVELSNPDHWKQLFGKLLRGVVAARLDSVHF